MSLSIEYLTSQTLAAGAWKKEENLLIAMPFTLKTMAKKSAELMATRAGLEEGSIVCVLDDQQQGFVAMCNHIFRHSRSRYFVYMAQDAFAGRRCMAQAIDVLGTDKGLLAFNDGKWFGALAGFGLVRRDWAQNNYQGELFYPGYGAHYADVELTLIAMQQGLYTYDPHSVLIEVDWAKDKKKVQENDRNLYFQRLQHGFDGRVSRLELLKLFS
jgi:hypothetical protein